MIDSYRTVVLEFVAAVIQLAAEHPLPSLLVIVAVQVGMISAAARFLARKTAAREPVSAHRIYLAAIVLMLALGPAHYYLGGWEVTTLAESEQPDVSPQTDSQAFHLLTSLPTLNTGDETTLKRSSAVQDRQQAVQGNSSAIAELQSELPVNDPLESQAVFAALDNASTLSSASPDSSVPKLVSSFGLSRTVMITLVSLYIAGFFAVVLRFSVGTVRLMWLARCGSPLRGQAQSLMDSIAAEVGLRTNRRARVVDGVAMPLVFGVVRPVVLLPADFESWTLGEQRATLLHELTHVRRRDTVGQLLAVATKAIYWCHPSIWFLNRQLIEAREWATDEQAIRSGMDARQYAENLVNVVARIRTGRSLVQMAAIGMAAGSRLEDRLRQILNNASQRNDRQNLAAIGSVVVMLAITTLTTVRVVFAAEPPTFALPVLSPPLAVPQEKKAVADIDEASLVSRLAECDVLDVTSDQFDASFYASGQVLSSSGEPVAGAIVVLRESSTSRLSSDPGKYIYVPNRHLIRTDDVFARTSTDADGRFTFEDAKSPVFSKSWANSWRGDIVAAHPNFGVGNVSLPYKKERQRYDNNLQVTLRPTSTVTGKYLSPGGAPIRGATVRMVKLSTPSLSSRSSDRGIDLQMSQLSPQTLTDVNGEFVLREVPAGFVGSITLSHPQWLDSYSSFATSDDVPTGLMEMRGSDRDIQGMPVEVIADAGVLFTGRVIDPDGLPVDGARVSFGSTTTRTESDDDGHYRLKLASKLIDRYRQPDQDAKIYVWLDGTNGLLGRTLDVSVAELESGKPFEIQLQRGVRVTGTVVTEQGEPVADVLAYSISKKQGGSSTVDGTFDLLLEKSEHTLVFGTDEPGFALPKQIDLYRLAGKNDLSQVLHRTIDLTSGADTAIPPIVVSRLQSLRVVALLPDGEPAVGATVMIKDLQRYEPTSASSYVRPPRVIERSEPTLTGPSGAVDLTPQGVVTDDAYAEVKLATNGKAYDGEALISAIKNGVVTVELKAGWIVEGRVLLDDEAFQGVRVAVGESTPNVRTVNGRTYRGSTVGNFQEGTADEDGWYRVPVRAGKEYSVSIRELPGIPDSRVGVGYRAGAEEGGRLVTKPFTFKSGDQQIAGVVVDQDGAPVVGANVSVMRTSRSQPEFWLGHRAESQSMTDAAGKFRLKNVPVGSYTLRVSGPRNGAKRSPATSVTAEAASTDLEITLASEEAPAELPRLQPRRIETIIPSSREK